MDFKCKECDKKFSSERSLHSHIKAHDLRVVSYYQKFYPRHDLYDGSIIKFKSNNSNIEIGIDHTAYSHTTKLTEENIKSLLLDFN